MQTAHAVADYAAENPEIFRQWKRESNSIISLSVPTESDLKKWYDKLSEFTSVTYFAEPDIGNQWTAICLYADGELRSKLRYLPLALKSHENNRIKKEVAI